YNNNNETAKPPKKINNLKKRFVTPRETNFSSTLFPIK
ncbi:unnamed protein product, partial [marine sediment metagenome]